MKSQIRISTKWFPLWKSPELSYPKGLPSRPGNLSTSERPYHAWKPLLVAYNEHPQRLDIDTRSAHNSTASPPEVRPPSAPADTASFILSAQSFDTIATMPKELYHIGTRDYGMLKNGSTVSYGLSDPRFAIESKRRTKRGLLYEKAIFPRNSYGLGVTAPESISRPIFTFDKVTLTKGQVLRVYFYERGGARNFCITLSPNDINRARRL